MPTAASTIDAMKQYAVAIKRIAYDFYDERFQPKPEVKAAQRGFWDLEWMTDLPDVYSNAIDQEAVIEALKHNDYKRYMKMYVSSSTAELAVLEDKKGNWSCLRMWKKDTYETRQGRSVSPLILQPYKKIEINNGLPIEILPYVPIVDIEHKFGGNVSFRQALAVQNDLRKAFDRSGANISFDAGLTDMCVLPNGQIIFADPGHSHPCSDFTDAMVQEQFSAFGKSFENEPDIQALFDYVDLTTGHWSQDKFFKNQLKK